MVEGSSELQNYVMNKSKKEHFFYQVRQNSEGNAI